MLYLLTVHYPTGSKTYTFPLYKAVNFGKLSFELGFDFDIKEAN